MKIILISGKAENGKDTAANILKIKLEQQGKKVLIAHYGDLVKYVCKTFFGWNGEKDDYGRTLLQQVGTNKIRKMYPNFWVDFIIKIATVFYDEWDFILIPDTRFPNEIEAYKEDVFYWDIISLRVGRVGHKSSLSKEQQQHPSETALDDYNFDYSIYTPDLVSLDKEINKFIKILLNNGRV